MASSLADHLKTVLFEDATNLSSERTRSLPICRFEAGHKHFSMETAFDFGGICAFEKQFDGFFEICGGRFDGIPLAGHIQFRTERDVA